ncbi:glycine cleavage system protein H [candidate division KSB1 bacterium]
MESFSYVDIFSTKGIEYLMVIGYLVLFVFFWRVLLRPVPAEEGLEVKEKKFKFSGNWFKMPQGYYFHQGHSWAKPIEESIVTVGINDFAHKMLGDPDKIELPEKGTNIVQGEKGWSFKYKNDSVDMLSPVNGEIIEVNKDVVEHPESISKELYKNGWLMKVKVSKLKTDLKNLISENLADAWISQTENIVRQKYSGSLSPVLQDGGTPVKGFVRQLSPDNWHEIANEFLKNE